jgi:hypothetical protein
VIACASRSVANFAAVGCWWLGGAGFLGRNAIDTLAELGANITALVRQARDFGIDSYPGINP